ncbi:MAG: TetR/AcrR family transcriptional regulator [Treponema sp.]|jgi:AcrR family transcriptional regulator|nr:TetR/AcrR family transcriptional regulator [Treponema sp.]
MTREDIITTAFDVWGRHCYQSMSLTTIAKALDVSKPALYRHFKNKDDLLNAMYRYFFDGYAAFIKPFYDTAQAKQRYEQILIMIRAMIEFYARNENFSIFFLTHVYGTRSMETMRRQLQDRGVDVSRYHAEPVIMRFTVATLTFILTHFHTHRNTGAEEGGKKPVTDEDIKKLTDVTVEKILYGLRFNKETVYSLEYERIEKEAASIPVAGEESALLKGIAAAIAESGPWDVSIQEIAQKSGLSKSSLYCHFENKRDMIMSFFMNEFERIIAFAEEGKRLSNKPEEQLYSIMSVIASYFHVMPDILSAMDWLKMRKILPPLETRNRYSDFGASHFSGLFSQIIPENDYASLTHRLIFFLIVHTLMSGGGGGTLDCERKEYEDFSTLDTNNLRILYRFITLGIDVSCAYAG